MIETIDSDIQTQLSGFHLPSDGSKIGGNAPKAYNRRLGIPGRPGGLLIDLSGGPYGTGEVYANRPWQSNTGNLRLDYLVCFSQNAYDNGDLFECDLKLSDGEWMYNFSHQWLFQGPQWVHQIASNAGWISAGITVSRDPADIFLPHSMTMQFDTEKHAMSVASIDGRKVTASMVATQMDPASKWPKGAYWQCQHTLNGNGGDYSCIIDGVTLTWW
jgi:hypothetical protein